MNGLSLAAELPPLAPDELSETLVLRQKMSEMPQFVFPVEHFLHAGMYVRTVMMPRGTALGGAVIKVPTVVTVSGQCLVKVGRETRVIDGYAILKGSSGRSQIFIATEDTYITMVFPSKAKTLEEAEEEFTDEFEQLQTRR